MTEISITEALKLGIQAHAAGDFMKADRYFTAILKVEPNHGDANHNMGILATSLGRLTQAEQFCVAALKINETIEKYWLSYIEVLARLGRIEDAKTAITEAKLKASSCEAISNIKLKQNGSEITTGVITKLELPALIQMYNDGHHSSLRDILLNIIQQNPNSFEHQNLLGVTSAQIDRLDEAVIALKKAIELRPARADIYNNLGVILIEQGQYNEGIKVCEKAIALKKDYAEPQFNIGNAFASMGKHNDAIAYYDRAIKLNPQYAAAHNNLGNSLKELGETEKAIAAYQHACLINEKYAEAKNNLGNALKDMGKLSEALDAYRSAIFLDPNNDAFFVNLGIMLQHIGDLDAAIDAYHKALSINPSSADANKNLSYTLLNKGNIDEGLDQYEQRWLSADFDQYKRHFTMAHWDASKSLNGKNILLWHEQGIGDTINWCAYIPLIAQRAQHCIFECPHKLVPLMKRSFPSVNVQSTGEVTQADLNRVDYQLPMGSLYKNLASDIYQEKPKRAYLIPDPTRIDFWRQRLQELGKGPFIGISWKSGTLSPKRLPNYAQLSDWAPIFKLENLTFINLQYSDFTEDLRMVKNEYGVDIHNFADLDHFNDIDDVAALCAALDMAISTKITVPFISAGVGTHTKLANWKQSVWNNVLLNPVGPNVDIYERNTWEPWDKVFNSIASDIENLYPFEN